ncbi:GNAT family N-acetyltransferase [Salinicola aestuarinus]|uniref:GNAT family N-acetyltransferase n=1 Tax=Salinicola aestuarinus TaxID=1949082 RepID=UPI000DA15C4C|nr:GNAT family N-acetyltransferase [Salinicola aestuarinus]
MIMTRPADRDDLDTLVPLVDAYRRFYGKSRDIEGVRDFMQARLANDDAEILLAFDDAAEDKRALGFAQLFPVPSTTDLAPRWILNDLYVEPAARRCGVGTALLESARELAASRQVPKLMLRTQVGNAAAKSRYEALGWQRDAAFDTYLLSV